VKDYNPHRSAGNHLLYGMLRTAFECGTNSGSWRASEPPSVVMIAGPMTMTTASSAAPNNCREVWNFPRRRGQSSKVPFSAPPVGFLPVWTDCHPDYSFKNGTSDLRSVFISNVVRLNVASFSVILITESRAERHGSPAAIWPHLPSQPPWRSLRVPTGPSTTAAPAAPVEPDGVARSRDLPRRPY